MDTIAETIKFAGFGKKKAMANQIQMFDDRLTEQGETLLAVCASIKGTKQLYVTDQRIILHETKVKTMNFPIAPLDKKNSTIEECRC